jgi:hypothetical protein
LLHLTQAAFWRSNASYLTSALCRSSAPEAWHVGQHMHKHALRQRAEV